MKIDFTKVLLVISLTLISPYAAYGDATFDKICSVMKEKDAFRKAEIKEMYKDRPLSGKGYVAKLTKGTSGNIVHISTEKNPNSPEAVSVMCFIKSGYENKYGKLKVGSPLSFKGILFNIIYTQVIVKETELK